MTRQFTLNHVGVNTADFYCRECGWMLVTFKDRDDNGRVLGFRVYHSKHDTCPYSESETKMPSVSVGEMLGIKT